MDLDDAHYSPENTSALHTQRLHHTPSKLPAFRFADLQRSKTLPVSASPLFSAPKQRSRAGTQVASQIFPDNNCKPSSPTKATSKNPATETNTTGAAAIPAGGFGSARADSYSGSYPSNSPSRLQGSKRGRKAPPSHSSDGIATYTGLPPALSSTQRSFLPEPAGRPPNKSTTDWASAQQQLVFEQLQSGPTTTASRTTTDTTKPHKQQPARGPASRTRIPPIRAFRSSATRASLGMDSRAYSQYESADDQDDRDRTLRALEGNTNGDHHGRRGTYSREQEYHDQARDQDRTEDLFLDLALNDLSRQQSSEDRDKTITPRRVSRIALPSNRSSLPQLTNSYPTPMPRRGSDLQGASTPYFQSNETPAQSQQVERQKFGAYAPGRTSPTPASPPELNKPRYPPSATRSTPTTPRVFTPRESTYDTPPSYSGRRPSITDSSAGSLTRGLSYRQSNLSAYSTPRMYNSSPLVLRTVEPDNDPEPPRATESTDDGTTSTTAPSTVWDELDDLKSRIRKLELTGKLPPTSGAAVSHASTDRPPTATTSATTISTSPKRGRGASMSLLDTNESQAAEAHPLLLAALAKSKSVLNPDIYKALDSAAADALAVASMVGSVGQQVQMSSAQSVIGSGPGSVADRQLRRKADSMCRSLTELCIALSDASQSRLGNFPPARPTSRGKELQIQVESAEVSPRQPVAAGDTLNRTKNSPSRALSRFEARRSSLLTTSALPSPRFASNELTTPVESSIASRRMSIMLRRQRPETEERDAEDDTRFRALSRAATEVGFVRKSPREYTSQLSPQQQSPSERPSTVISNLPIRRQYLANLSPSSAIPNVVPQKRYLDRAAPDRDTSSVIGRLAEERGLRPPVSVVQNMDIVKFNRTRSLVGPNPRLRTRSNVMGGNGANADSSAAMNLAGYR